MSRFKVQKRGKKVLPKLTAVQKQAVGAAIRSGLYILFEKPWRIYDKRTGNVLASYWSDSGRCVLHIGPVDTPSFVETHFINLMARLRATVNAH